MRVKELKLKRQAGTFSTCFAHNLCFKKATLLHSSLFH
jgi:hypothetical protein